LNPFGAHVSIAGGVHKAPSRGAEATCDVVQIFTKNQMQWRVPPLTEEEVERFQQEVERVGIPAVCVHAAYLINLGSPDPVKLEQSRKAFRIELERAEVLGIRYVIVHPGAHMDSGEETGIATIAESLNLSFAALKDTSVMALLECTAGQGTNLGHRFEELAAIIDRVEDPSRVGVCVDTCHLFAAGYELRSREGYESTIRELDDVVGVDRVRIIHSNDSKRELGSRVDRHAHIGEGELGLEAFRHFINDPRFDGVPMIIETPGGPEKDRENLARLRRLVARRKL